MSDLLRTLAFAYRRSGADTLERAKLLHLLTFDLRWLAPDVAKRLVTRALQHGLLREEGDRLRVAFDTAAVDVPVNFRPRDDVADEEAPLHVPTPGEDAVAAERARRGGLVSADVAALLVARRRGEDVREKARDLERRLTGA